MFNSIDFSLPQALGFAPTLPLHRKSCRRPWLVWNNSGTNRLDFGDGPYLDCDPESFKGIIGLPLAHWLLSI